MNINLTNEEMDLHFQKRSRTRQNGCAATGSEVRNSDLTGVRERNRISKFLIRILPIIAVLLAAPLTSKAASLLEYSHSLPENNSTISSFDIKLVFDLSKVIAENGEAEYGIGHAGYYFEGDDDINKSTALYEGVGDSKTLISRIFTSNVNGQSEDFETGGEVSLSFPGCFPTPGKQYTLIVNNNFDAYIKGVKSKVKNTNVAFMESPLVLTFTGGGASAEILSIEDCNISNNAYLSELSEVRISYNKEIKIADGAEILLCQKGDNSIHSRSIESIGKTLVATFQPQLLLNGHEYTIQIPQGIVESVDGLALTNSEFSIIVNGTGFNRFGGVSYKTIDNNGRNLPTEITATFNLPAGYKLLTNMGDYSNFTAKLYKDAVSDDNLCLTMTGTPSSDGCSLIWQCDEAFIPATKYVLHVPANQFTAWKDRTYEDCINEEIKLEFTAPSIAEAGFEPMVFDTPIIGKHGVSTKTLDCSKPVESLSTIEVCLKDYDYYLDGKKRILFYCKEAVNKGYVYDVTTGEEVLVKEFSNSLQTRETSLRYYTVISAVINATFFEGHRYRVFIPEGTYCVDSQLKNYIFNQPMVYEFDGGTPDKVSLVSCSLQEGEVRTALSSVAYEFKGTFKLTEGATAKLKMNTVTFDVPVSVSYSGSNTWLLVNCVNSSTGEPWALTEGREYSVTLPAGTLFYEANPEMVNEEIVRTFIGKETTAGTGPEFVKLHVTIGGLDHAANFATAHKTTIETVKEHKATVQLAPSSDWKVTALTLDGKDVFDDIVFGFYITPELTADSQLVATVEYNGPEMTVDHSTGVATVPESNITVARDGEQLVIKGVNPTDTIHIYSVSGLLIRAVEPQAGCDVVRVAVPQGQTYVVLVNKYAAKIQF